MCPTWLKYPEDMAAKLNIPMMKRHAALVRRLHSLAPNMSFTQAAMESAMRVLLERRGDEWRLEQTYHAEWVKVNALRVRVMCRHVANALCKQKQPSWVKEVLLLDDETAEPMDAQEEASGEEGEEEEADEEEEEEEEEEAHECDAEDSDAPARGPPVIPNRVTSKRLAAAAELSTSPLGTTKLCE